MQPEAAHKHRGGESSCPPWPCPRRRKGGGSSNSTGLQGGLGTWGCLLQGACLPLACAWRRARAGGGLTTGVRGEAGGCSDSVRSPAGAARAGLLKASDVDPLSPASPLPAGTRDPFSVVKRGGSPPALVRGLQEEGRDPGAWQGAGSESPSGSPSGSSAAPPGLRWGVGPAGAEGCCAPDEPGGPCGDLPQGLCPQEGPSGGSGRPPPGPARGPLLTWGPARAAGRWRGGGGGPASPGRRAGVWAPPRRGWAVGREGLARRGRLGGLPGLGKGPEQKWFLFQRLPAWPRPHHSLLINRFLLPSSLPGPQARPAPARLPDPGQPPSRPRPPTPPVPGSRPRPRPEPPTSASPRGRALDSTAGVARGPARSQGGWSSTGGTV